MTNIETAKRSKPGLKSILIRAAVGSLGMRIAQAFLGVAISILMARLLGVEGLGTYAAIIAGFQMLLIPIQSGLCPLIARQMVRFRIQESWQMARGLVLWAVAIGILYTAFLSISMLAVRPYMETLRMLSVPILTAGVLVIVLGRLSSAYHRGLRQVLIGQSFDLIRNIVLAAIAVAVLTLAIDLNPYHAVTAFILSGGVASCILIVWAIKTTPREMFDVRSSAYAGSEWIRMSFTFMLITGAMQIADLSGIIMTRTLAGATQAGLFQTAYQLSTLVLFGLGAITMAIGPYFTQLHETGDKANLARLARRAAQASTAFAAVFAIAIILAGETILTSFYGADFAAGQPILVAVTLTYLIQASTGASTPLLIATGYEKSMLKISLVAVTAAVATSAVLIPVLGGLGCALGVVVSMAILNAGTWWKCRQALGIDTFFIPIPIK